MKKSSIMVLIFLVAASIFVAGCASKENGVTNETSQAGNASAITELNFGYQPSTHQIAYMTAKEKGWWQEDLAPFGVKKINEFVFPTGAPEMQAMLAGKLDVAYVGSAPVITAISNQGLDAKIVAAVQVNGSNLVLRPEFKYNSPQDLKGLKIATFPVGTIQDTILRTWLKQNGLDPEKDVDIRPMGPGDAVSAISAKQVDAVFLPQPSPAVIESEGNGRSVVSSGQMSANHACCVLLVSGKLIREHPEIVDQIVKTHIKATEYNKENTDEAAQIFSNMTGQDLKTVKKSINEWDGVWISDPNVIVNSTVQYAQNQYDLGYITKTLSKEEIFDTSFYDAAAKQK